MGKRCTKQKADYSKIAQYFDKARPVSGQTTDFWLKLISRYSKAGEGAAALDLGCGTGRWTLPMASTLDYRMTGADASPDMLEKAKEKDTAGLAKWELVDANNMGYPDGSFSVIFMSHLLHHIDSPDDVIKDCQRILSSPGAVLIRHSTIEQVRDGVVHRFFKETRNIDEARYPTRKMVENWLWAAGFKNVISKEVTQQTCDTGIARLNAAKAKSISVLTLISQEDFKNGISCLEKHVKENPNDPSLLFDRLTLTVGYKRM